MPPVGSPGQRTSPVDSSAAPREGVMEKAGHRDRLKQVGMALWAVALTASLAWWNWSAHLAWATKRKSKREGSGGAAS